MLTEKHLPTRMIPPSERPPVPVAPPQKPSLLRGLSVFLHFFGFVALLLTAKLSKKLDKAVARRLRNVLEQFGTLWVKAGQVLSTRGDLLSPEIGEELSKIKDTGKGVPFADVRRIIENESGVPLESVYEQFEERPFAVSSLAQLHRACLRHEKRLVAVKVHKPFIDQMVSQDRALMQWVVRLLVFVPIYPKLCWEDLYVQAEELTLRELDFRYEESSLHKLKKKLCRHGVYVSDTFRRYSGRRVLVMEFIRAALMSDFIALEKNDPVRLQAWLKKNNVDPKRVARRLFFSIYRQIFEDNLFHADMHPGNVVLLRNSRIAIIDCRSMAFMETELLDKYRMCLQGIASQHYETAADIYLLLAARLPAAVEVSIVKADLIRTWRNWSTQTYIKQLPYSEKSITHMFEHLNKIVFDHRFAVQWPLSKMSRALLNLDASLNSLNPKLNYCQYLQHYFQKARRRTTKQDLRRMPERIPRSLSAMREMPGQFSEVTLFQQSILRRQAQSIQGKITTAGYVLSAFFGLMSLLFLLLGGLCVCAFLYHCFAYPIESIVGKQLAAAVFMLPELNCLLWIGTLLLVSYCFLLGRRLKKRFEQVETIVPDMHAAI
ncbi:MAG: AarF/ABC1/UbiB kinase family protein [Gammaproteobacteria bacterium]|nr:AarF/ABC1/UbiB kinase family protein [Gammaproteobacteria bacterium]